MYIFTYKITLKNGIVNGRTVLKQELDQNDIEINRSQIYGSDANIEDVEFLKLEIKD